jgi:hypothetical protein
MTKAMIELEAQDIGGTTKYNNSIDLFSPNHNVHVSLNIILVL